MAKQLHELNTDELTATIKLNSISFIVKKLHAGETLHGLENGKYIQKTFNTHAYTKHLKEK